MSLYVRFDTNNAAFADDERGEVARILRQVADRIEQRWDIARDTEGKSQTILDVNGNDVGRWQLEVRL